MTDDNIKKSNKKNDKYQKEQEQVVKKLNSILEIDEANNRFLLEQLKQDEEKQKQILELEEDVKKFFVYHDWPYFKNTVSNRWLSLLRSIYKHTNYEITYKQKQKNGDKYTEYKITKNI
jgi:hypothetical protein